jgi:hypothetical protein
VDGAEQRGDAEPASLASQLQLSIGIASLNAPVGSPIHWYHPVASTSFAPRRVFLLRISGQFECIGHSDGRTTFEDAAEWPVLDVSVCRLADALRNTWVKCAEGDNMGCGAVFLRKHFQRHFSEVKHHEDFGYMTQPAEAPADAE